VQEGSTKRYVLRWSIVTNLKCVRAVQEDSAKRPVSRSRGSGKDSDRFGVKNWREAPTTGAPRAQSTSVRARDARRQLPAEHGL
jgi:hypothetical protein